jgi:hypothetical protein
MEVSHKRAKARCWRSKERRKAEAESCVAKTIVGISYLYGCIVEVDYKQAFLSAAGTSRAVLNLGTMHAKGLGIPHHLPEAIRLFEAVAKPSHSPDALAARIAFTAQLRECLSILPRP